MLLSFLKALLNRRDWVYSLSLLIPIVVYDLALKAYDVASRPVDHGLAQTLDLMQSDVFFGFGYALLWIGLFAVVRRRNGPARWAVVFLFHTTAVLVVLVITCAHRYFQVTGSTLDYTTAAEWVSKLAEIVPILVHGVSLSAWILLATVLLYAALAPWLLTRAIERWQGWPGATSVRTAGVSFLGPLGLWLLALGFGSLSLLVGSCAGDSNASLARDPFVNVALTGIEGTSTEEDYPGANSVTEHPPAGAHLSQKPQTEKRNVVLVHLESTRAQSLTPYNEDLKTTPFLEELAKSSLLAEQAHVVLPRSSKGSVAVNCGIEPPLYPGPEFKPGGIPAPCLPNLLKEQSYSTVLFSSTSSSDFGDLVKNFGYQEYYSSGSMDFESFKTTNTFGYEDDIMLKPSEEWLTEHKEEPFMAEYFTGTGHYGYECLGTRYGDEDFSEDDQLNRYLNCLRLQDIFLQNLFDQYKELGLYDNTIFVLFGDHGEGLGEHDRFMHGDTIWEEGLRVPLIIHAQGWFEGGHREEQLSSQIDVLPTVLEMLGYGVEGGKYPGYSLLHPLPEDRTLRFSCISSRTCMASIKGSEKYIYHYGNQPDEIFNLSKDPLEEHNLAILHSKEDIDQRRENLLTWRWKVNAQYGPILINGTPYSESNSP